MNSKNIRKMVSTSILVALTIVFQLMRPLFGGTNPVSTYIVGSLVNLCLVIAACGVGLWSGVSVAVITPLIALMQGHAVIFMVPWIMIGNAILSVSFALFTKVALGNAKADWIRFIVVGLIATAIKYAVIVLGQSLMMVTSKGAAFQIAISAAAVAQIQQIVTALISIVLAKLVILALPKSLLEK